MPEVSYPLDPAGLQAINVLLIEDDPGDVLMTREAFELSPVPSTLHVVGDGEQAMHFLRRTSQFTGAPRPGLILLDLNLPRRNGLEVLAELKADPDLLTIPVVILTTSQAETDIVATELERRGSDVYGGSDSRVSPVWARNPSMSAGRYWMRLSRFLTIAASWSTSRAERLPRPFFIFAQAPSAGLRSGA